MKQPEKNCEIMKWQLLPQLSPLGSTIISFLKKYEQKLIKKVQNNTHMTSTFHLVIEFSFTILILVRFMNEIIDISKIKLYIYYIIKAKVRICVSVFVCHLTYSSATNEGIFTKFS